MDNKFGMQVPLNPPEVDFDAGTIAYKLSVCSVENLDNAIFSEICKIAKEKGVTTLVALDKQKIVDALNKATPKKVKRTSQLIRGSSPDIPPRYVESIACPTCQVSITVVNKHCDQCGQKLDWED